MSIMSAPAPKTTPPITPSTVSATLKEGRKLKDLIESGASEEEIASYIVGCSALAKALESEVEAGKVYFRARAVEVFKTSGTSPVVFASPAGPIKVSDLGRKTVKAVKSLLTEGKAKMSAAIYGLLFQEETTVKPVTDFQERLKTLPAEVQGSVMAWVAEGEATPKVELPSLPTA